MHKGGCRLWEATMDREIFAREISSKRKRLEDLAQQIWENPEEPFQSIRADKPEQNLQKTSRIPVGEFRLVFAYS